MAKYKNPKCRKCPYRSARPNLNNCDYILIAGHSRGCDVKDCRHWDDKVDKNELARRREIVYSIHPENRRHDYQEKGNNDMRLGKYLTSLTKPELEYLRENLNLTEDQFKIFELLLKGGSRDFIADKVNVSPATVGNRIGEIVKKINRLKEMDVK